MTRSILCRCLATGLLAVVAAQVAAAEAGGKLPVPAEGGQADQWPRFRGPNGTGVSTSVGLPEKLEAAASRIWKVDAGNGSSSPIVADGRLFLTSYDGNTRFVACLDAKTGESVWKQSVEKLRDETASHPNSPATCTPVTDGENVVAFFPDSGLFCYSADGKLRWRVELGPFHSMHGIGGSPILVDGLVVLSLDQLRGSRLSAYRLTSGELAWDVPRIDGLTGAYSTPSVVARDGSTLIVTSGPQELCGYRTSTGEKVWSLPGLTNAPIALPVVAGNWVFTCEPVGTAAPFSMLAPMDNDKDGKYSLEEGKTSLPMYRLLERIDTDTGNGDGMVEPTEWDAAFGGFLNKGGLVAVDLRAIGQAKSPEVRWTYRKSVPYIASPLVFGRVLYIVQDGGIVTTIEAETGKVFRRGRLSQGGKQFYASPVAADGKVFLLDTEGRLTVLKAGEEWEELSSIALDEPCFATPAIYGGRLYVRTAKGLYCFGEARNNQEH